MSNHLVLPVLKHLCTNLIMSTPQNKQPDPQEAAQKIIEELKRRMAQEQQASEEKKKD